MSLIVCIAREWTSLAYVHGCTVVDFHYSYKLTCMLSTSSYSACCGAQLHKSNRRRLSYQVASLVVEVPYYCI